MGSQRRSGRSFEELLAAMLEPDSSAVEEIRRALADGEGDDDSRGLAFSRLASFYAFHGHFDEAFLCLTTARDLLERIGNVHRLRRWVIISSLIRKHRFEYDELLHDIETMLGLPGQDGLDECGAVLHLEKAECLARRGRYFDALRSIEDARPFLKTSYDQSIPARLEWQRAVILESLGEVDAAWSALESALVIARHLHDPHVEWTIRQARVANRDLANDSIRLREELREARIVADLLPSNADAWKQNLRVSELKAEIRAGAPVRRIIEELMVIVDYFEGHQSHPLSYVPKSVLAEILYGQGRYDEALMWAKAAAESVDVYGDLRPVLDVYELLGKCYVATGDDVGAYEALVRRSEVAERGLSPESSVYVETLDAIAEVRKVELDRRSRMAELSSSMSTVQSIRSALADVENLLTEARRQGSSIDLADRILVRLKSVVPDDAPTDWSRFAREFERAHPGFRQTLARRAPQLSERETLAALLLRAGLGTKDIARVLDVSDRTVELYRSTIRRGLGLEAGKSLIAELIAIDSEVSDISNNSRTN